MRNRRVRGVQMVVAMLAAMTLTAGCNLQNGPHYRVVEFFTILEDYVVFGSVATSEFSEIYVITCNRDPECFRSQVEFYFDGQYGTIDDPFIVTILTGKVDLTDPAYGGNISDAQLEVVLGSGAVDCMAIRQRLRVADDKYYYDLVPTGTLLTCNPGVSTGLPPAQPPSQMALSQS